MAGLPRTIRQEDGSRNRFEFVFQSMDSDLSKNISLEELSQYLACARRAKSVPNVPTSYDDVERSKVAAYRGSVLASESPIEFPAGRTLPSVSDDDGCNGHRASLADGALTAVREMSSLPDEGIEELVTFTVEHASDTVLSEVVRVPVIPVAVTAGCVSSSIGPASGSAEQRPLCADELPPVSTGTAVVEKRAGVSVARNVTSAAEHCDGVPQLDSAAPRMSRSLAALDASRRRALRKVSSVVRLKFGGRKPAQQAPASSASGAAMFGTESIADYVFDRNFDVAVARIRGGWPLHPPAGRDACGFTALHAACMVGNHVLLQAILKRDCARVALMADASGLTPLHHACRRCPAEMVAALAAVAPAATIVQDGKGWTPLHECAARGMRGIDALTALLQHCPADTIAEAVAIQVLEALIDKGNPG